jgi:hypothetical protein
MCFAAIMRRRTATEKKRSVQMIPRYAESGKKGAEAGELGCCQWWTMFMWILADC